MRCFLTSVVYADCEHGLWNSEMYRDLSENQATVGK